ncbi:MAG: hypothetical protein AABX08_03695 [Nanoarchaeota archaeon]
MQQNIGQFENFDIDSAELSEILEFREIVSQVSSSLNQLILTLIIFAVLIYLTYTIIKSAQWNIIQNNKLTNFKKYFLKFSMLSIFLHVILAVLIFNILKYSRTFLISYIFEGNFTYAPFVRLIIIGLILIFVFYLFFILYIKINKLSLSQSFKEAFKFKKFHLFFIFILISIMSALIVRYGLILSSSVISISIQGILVAFLITWYKIFLNNQLEA